MALSAFRSNRPAGWVNLIGCVRAGQLGEPGRLLRVFHDKDSVEVHDWATLKPQLAAMPALVSDLDAMMSRRAADGSIVVIVESPQQSVAVRFQMAR